MSEFEAEVKKAEKELEQSLVPIVPEETGGQGFMDDEFLGDLKIQAQEYGHRLQDAASKARDFAGEKFAQAGDKFKELQNILQLDGRLVRLSCGRSRRRLLGCRDDFRGDACVLQSLNERIVECKGHSAFLNARDDRIVINSQPG